MKYVIYFLMFCTVISGIASGESLFTSLLGAALVYGLYWLGSKALEKSREKKASTTTYAPPQSDNSELDEARALVYSLSNRILSDAEQAKQAGYDYYRYELTTPEEQNVALRVVNSLRPKLHARCGVHTRIICDSRTREYIDVLFRY